MLETGTWEVLGVRAVFRKGAGIGVILRVLSNSVLPHPGGDEIQQHWAMAAAIRYINSMTAAMIPSTGLLGFASRVHILPVMSVLPSPHFCNQDVHLGNFTQLLFKDLNCLIPRHSKPSYFFIHFLTLQDGHSEHRKNNFSTLSVPVYFSRREERFY